MTTVSGTRHPRAPLRRWALILITTVLAGCASAPPRNLDDLCTLFAEKRDWYRDARRAERAWGTPIDVQMAIMHQESRFAAKAKPPRTMLLGFIPAGRSSSAYGYAQAKDSTWDWYIRRSGNAGADRDKFADAVDFVAWYVDTSHAVLGIPKSDAYRQYLAYHEGHGGYRRGSYKTKQWLTKVASRVDARSRSYRAQLSRCRADLEKARGWWPF